MPLYNFTSFRMPRYAQLVVGPAGSGKSTYCKLMQDHFAVIKRQCMGESHNMADNLILRDIGSAFSRNHKYFSKSVSDFSNGILNSILDPTQNDSELNDDFFKRFEVDLEIHRRCMSDPTLSDIDFKNTMALV